MTLDLLTFMTNLFIKHHFSVLLISLESESLTSITDFPSQHKVVTSAYLWTIEFLQCSAKSLTYNIKNKGPNMNPWGTPCVNLHFLKQNHYSELFDISQMNKI